MLAQQPTPGLLVHSDRGGQYCGNAYRRLLHHHQAVPSQSRRGECYDNAQAESLWSRLKTEELDAREWPVFVDLADAQTSVADYFDYYNHQPNVCLPALAINCRILLTNNFFKQLP